MAWLLHFPSLNLNFHTENLQRTYSYLIPSSDTVICLYSSNIMLWYHPLKIGSHDSPKHTRLQFLDPIFWQISLNDLSLLSVLFISLMPSPSGCANHCYQRLVWPLNYAVWILILPCLSKLPASIWQVTTPWRTASFSSGVWHCPCFPFLPLFFFVIGFGAPASGLFKLNPCLDIYIYIMEN